MVNLFAWASIGENGKATGGKKGDQTKKEVKVAQPILVEVINSMYTGLLIE